MGRHPPCLASLVFPRAELSARICLGFRNAITRCIAFCPAGRYDAAMTDDLELRASDADRDRAAAVLGGALATGRLTSAEYAERLDSVYVAKTLGALLPPPPALPAGHTPHA